MPYFIFLILFIVSLEASSRSASIEIDQLNTPVATIESMQMTLHWPDHAEAGEFSLEMKSLNAADYGYHWRDVDWVCSLLKTDDGAWGCDGKLTARGAGNAVLSLRINADFLSVSLVKSKQMIELKQAFSSPETRIELVRVPAVWLQPALKKSWGDGQLTGGEVAGKLAVVTHHDNLNIGGALSFSKLGVDSRDGSLAAEGVSGEGRLQVDIKNASPTIGLDFTLQGGEVLLGALYAALPETGIQLSAKFAQHAANQWKITNALWRDSGVFELKADALIDPSADTVLQEANVRAQLLEFEAAHRRYFDSLLASFGLSGAKTGGAAALELLWQHGEWQSVDVNFTEASFHDGQSRFAVEGVTGDWKLRKSSEAQSRIAWQKANLHGIQLGASAFDLHSAQGGMQLTSPVAVPMLGGALEIKQLAYEPGSSGAELALSLAAKQLDLAALSTTLGWPAFSGEISGELPSAFYADERLVFNGGLKARVFDGEVSVANLSMERPFGVAPMLAASLQLDGLNLQPLTSAFGFGEITGRMDGHVEGLRLVDWEPVSFDAAFYTTEQRGEKRRISQRAVRELTEVGGGGLAAGLQAQVLSAFSSFGYNKIGLSCVLVNNVCTMGGVGQAKNGGYVIVEGSGLPRVDVIGHQKRVDWPVLLERLLAATRGQMPVIE